MTGRLLATAAVLVLILLSLGGCAAGQLNPTPIDRLQTACIDPRPQACTMDYTPVCAELKNGELKTYSNGCSACADVNVLSHRVSACE